ncbi:MAG: PepSY domain-containing protein [Hydrogenophaga sp.]|nr:PepSY domain-containing protein [Hydrogenophaga sp.]
MALHGSALASSDGDHERALQAVQSGQVLPLTQVLALVERTHPGQVLEVELESHDRQWQYEIKLLQPDGRLLKLKIDARSGSILKRKTR